MTLFSSPPQIHPTAPDVLATSNFSRRGRGGRSAKLLGDFARMRRGRSGRGGICGRPSLVDGLSAGRGRCGRCGRCGNLRRPSLDFFVGVPSESRPGPESTLLSGLRRRGLTLDLIRILLGVSRDLAPRSASSSVTYSNESGRRMVDWGYSFF